jgi:hypothetical protein
MCGFWSSEPTLKHRSLMLNIKMCLMKIANLNGGWVSLGDKVPAVVKILINFRSRKIQPISWAAEDQTVFQKVLCSVRLFVWSVFFRCFRRSFGVFAVYWRLTYLHTEVPQFTGTCADDFSTKVENNCVRCCLHQSELKGMRRYFSKCLPFMWPWIVNP